MSTRSLSAADTRELCGIPSDTANQPVHRLLGARRDKILVYAATSRLLAKEQMVGVVQGIVAAGFRAVKLRLHRPDPRDDLAVVEAVRKAAGDDLTIVVDANQNHASPGYCHWTRRTALKMARELDSLNVYFLEEPLPMRDVEASHLEIAQPVEDKREELAGRRDTALVDSAPLTDTDTDVMDGFDRVVP